MYIYIIMESYLFALIFTHFALKLFDFKAILFAEINNYLSLEEIFNSNVYNKALFKKKSLLLYV